MTTIEICGILSRNLSRDTYSKVANGVDNCVSIIMGKSGVKNPVKQKRITEVIQRNSSADFYDCGSVKGDMEIIAEEINAILKE